jgi:hypothetical protein
VLFACEGQLLLFSKSLGWAWLQELRPKIKTPFIIFKHGCWNVIGFEAPQPTNFFDGPV